LNSKRKEGDEKKEEKRKRDVSEVELLTSSFCIFPPILQRIIIRIRILY